jgi:two-component system CheB/CheR fusion protein
MLKNKSAGAPLRIWAPGCSTGQEAYSLAIALTEFLDEKIDRPSIQIFATDLSDQVSLQKAREGLYPENIAGEVSPERLRRFFTKEDGKYRVSKAIRDMCLFAKQNVAADPPFSRVDLISCRNLLIYLAPQLQKRVIPTFHYALNPEGFLLLGASETIGTASDLFALVDRHHRIYRKRNTPVRGYPHFSVDDMRKGAAQRPRDRDAEPSVNDWLREADRLVLSQYSPPGALINSEFEVLQFRGETGAYLKPSPGEASLNLLKMAREGLFLELRSAVAECRTRKVEVRHNNVRVRGDEGTRKIDLRVLPVLLPGKSEECFLVLFEDEEALARLQFPVEGAGSPEDAKSPSRLRKWIGRNAQPAIKDDIQKADEKTLRQELASTREYLQSVIEEQDAANEELKSANEEVLSTNEELQSTNEELETAKEELQSVNEELTTVNEQLQTRNVELSRLNDDVSNLIASTNMPMVSVGLDMRIRRLTPAAAKLFNILPTDLGRPIGNLRPAIEVPELEAMIGEAIDTVQPRERQVRDKEGRHHMLRVHPYRTSDNKIDGAVIVLLDVEQVTAQAARLRENAALLELSADAIIVRNHDSIITFWNRGAEDTYGWKASEAIGKNSHALLQGGSGTGSEIDSMLRASERWQGELAHVKRDGTKIIVESRHVVQRAPGGEVLSILEINRDITEQRRMMDRLAAEDRAKNEFLATLGHELRNPLTPLRNCVEVLRMIGGTSPEAVEVRDTIQRNVRRMTRLIDDLLDMSRVTHGHIELQLETVDLTRVIKEVIVELRSMAEAASNKVAVRLPAEPVFVDGDPVRLTQIVENVVHNAIKYTDGGKIDVALGVDDGSALLRVRDTGIGMTPEVLPRIWDPFVQGDTSLERRRSGLGLGLTLVRKLIDMHGGSIAASSEGPDKGSEFVMSLPLAKHRPAAASAPRRKAPLKDRRILIVDDNQDAAMSFSSLLKLMENDVRTAGTGQEALRVAKEFRPEIVLLDIGLPEMNGFDVAKALRRDHADDHLVIVAVSGYGAEADRQRSAQAGFDAHFVKPLEIEALQEFLGSRQ